MGAARAHLLLKPLLLVDAGCTGWAECNRMFAALPRQGRPLGYFFQPQEYCHRHHKKGALQFAPCQQFDYISVILVHGQKH